MIGLHSFQKLNSCMACGVCGVYNCTTVTIVYKYKGVCDLSGSFVDVARFLISDIRNFREIERLQSFLMIDDL